MAVSIGDASYEVRYDPGGTNTDITEHVISIDRCKFVANEIKTAVMQLNSEFGAFITESNSGATPIISKWNQIKLSYTDKNDNVKSGIFLVKPKFPRRTPNENLRLELQMVAREFWLSVIPFPKPFHFENAFTMSKDIIDIYNGPGGKGSAQTTIENHDDTSENELPQFTANTFTFNNQEEFCWDALMEIVDNLGTSVSNGGAGDFFSIVFNDKSDDSDTIEFKAFVSGSKPASPLTIQNATITPISEIRGESDAETGSIVGAKGKKDTGSLPVDYADFRSMVEAWHLHPEHQSGVTYPSSVWIQKDGIHYESNTETSQTPPHADWTQREEHDWLGTRNYSIWTKNQADAWKNSGTNPSGAAGGTGIDFDQSGCWDINQVVLDEDNYQNWAHVKNTSDNFNLFYKYGSDVSGVYKGLRCLVNGTGTGAFAGHDNKLMQYDGNEWAEIGPKGNSGIRAAVDGDRIGIDDENIIYKFNGTSWVQDHTGQRKNHCYHIYDSIGQSQGVNQTDDGLGNNYGFGSAVKYTWKYTALSAIGSLPLTTVVNYYSMGAWANMQFPFPPTGYNSQTLGSLYGGDLTTKNPATLNTDNLIFTPSGKNGFNHSDSNSLLPITGLGIILRMDWFVDILGIDTSIPFEGNFKYRIFAYDINDNVIYTDVTLSFLKRFEGFMLPWSVWKIYRARSPLTFGNIPSNLIVPELEVLDVFNYRDIKKIGVQWQESYDSEGRYKPEGGRVVSAPLKLGAPAFGAEVTVELEIDAFYLVKQPLALSGTDSVRPIFPKFIQAPEVSNTFQLQQLVDSQLEIEQHEDRRYLIEQELRCDINEGESFYLVDPELISDNDDGSGGIKLVAQEVDITVNASDGNGGIQTTILGVKKPV